MEAFWVVLGFLALVPFLLAVGVFGSGTVADVVEFVKGFACSVGIRTW